MRTMMQELERALDAMAIWLFGAPAPLPVPVRVRARLDRNRAR